MARSEDHTRVRGLDPVLLVLLVLAAILRVREAVRTPLWYDELYSHAAVQGSFAEAMRLSRADVHPPLHFALSWGWRVFGESDLAVRSLSLLFGTGSFSA